MGRAEGHLSSAARSRVPLSRVPGRGRSKPANRWRKGKSPSKQSLHLSSKGSPTQLRGQGAVGAGKIIAWKANDHGLGLNGAELSAIIERPIPSVRSLSAGREEATATAGS